MTLLEYFMISMLVFLVVGSIRITVVHKARLRAIDLIYEEHVRLFKLNDYTTTLLYPTQRADDNCVRQYFQVWKWTVHQFYPDIPK